MQMTQQSHVDANRHTQDATNTRTQATRVRDGTGSCDVAVLGRDGGADDTMCSSSSPRLKRGRATEGGGACCGDGRADDGRLLDTGEAGCDGPRNSEGSESEQEVSHSPKGG